MTNMRYYLQDEDKAYSQVPVTYLKDDNIFVPNEEEMEDTAIEYAGMLVQVDNNGNAYVGNTEELLRVALGTKFYDEALECGHICHSEEVQ